MGTQPRSALMVSYGKTFSRMLQPATISVKGNYDDTEFAKLRRVAEEDSPFCIKRRSG